MTEQVRWLDAEEAALWRTFLALERSLHLEIQRDLKTTSGLTEPEFEVLVHLSEADGPLRMTALADALMWERSRVSHQVTRMAARGLVRRTSCPEDGRGAFRLRDRRGPARDREGRAGPRGHCAAGLPGPVGRRRQA